MFQTVTTEQAQALLASEPVRVFDLRDFRSYRAGHIDGAVLLHEGLEQRLLQEENFSAPLLLYCYRGIKSREKAEQLAQLGFTRIYTLDNGYTGWPRQSEGPR